jgi:hypothetical protein
MPLTLLRGGTARARAIRRGRGPAEGRGKQRGDLARIVAAAVVVGEHCLDLGVPRELAHAPDVAVHPVERAGDRGVPQPVG